MYNLQGKVIMITGFKVDLVSVDGGLNVWDVEMFHCRKYMIFFRWVEFNGFFHSYFYMIHSYN